MVTGLAKGAVHVHQTDLPPTFPACDGSPASLDAVPALVAIRWAALPPSVARLAKLLLAGFGTTMLMLCVRTLEQLPVQPTPVIA